MKKKINLDEFKKYSFFEWKEKFIHELKTISFEELSKENIDEIIIQPIYNKEIIENKYHDFFKLRKNFKNNNWIISQDYNLSNDLKIINKEIISDLNNGIESICLNGQKIKSYKELFQNIIISEIPIYLNIQKFCDNDIEQLKKFCDNNDFSTKKIIGSLENQPLSNFLITGNINTDNLIYTFELSKKINFEFSNFQTIKINGYQKHIAGATVIEEVAIALAEGHEYITQMLYHGFTIDEISNHIQFELSVDTKFLIEIGKLKAIRFLWAKIIEEYKPKKITSFQTIIHARTSQWSHSLLDAENNIIRNTIATMAASIAGVDRISVTPYDSIFEKENLFSKWNAKNIQLLLKKESYFDKVIDPTSGTHNITHIIDQIIEKSWKLFQEIEKQGGYLNAIQNNFIQNKIEISYHKKIKAIEDKKTILVGVNEYPNTIENIKNKKPLRTTNPIPIQKSSFKTLYKHRLAEKKESNIFSNI